MKLAIAGDSAGAPLAELLVDYLKTRDGLEVADLSKSETGTEEFYAGIAERTAKAVLSKRFDRAILVCGTGIGVCIAANKVPGIRAALTHDTYSAERAQLSNDAQIITLGARVIGSELAKSIVDAWLAVEFDSAGRSVANVQAIDDLDQKYHAKD